jgi:hypothetical protein
MDIRREVLGTDAVLGRAVNDVVALVESKEMARNALPTTTIVRLQGVPLSNDKPSCATLVYVSKSADSTCLGKP